MHAAPRRPAASWPAALLPGALLLALLSAGFSTASAGATPDAPDAGRVVTELQVVGPAR